MRCGAQLLRLVNRRVILHSARHCTRSVSSEPLPAQPRHEPGKETSFSVLQDLANTKDLQRELIEYISSPNPHLSVAASHLFTVGGKYFRPTCVMLMGRCGNHGKATSSTALHNQQQVALIAEMIHVASLIHDDVLDNAQTRRSLLTVNNVFNDKVAMVTGDYVIARATEKLSKINCSKTILILSSVIRDLIKGEIMQLNSTMSSDTLFERYLNKTYLKTASLLAHSCQAVTLHSPSAHLQNAAFEYGRNVGIAFQLIDDMLDFVASSSEMGKNTGADLELGLATAPVLYAARKHPRLLTLTERRFAQPGDIELALELVHDSDGIRQTKLLAERYCDIAVSQLDRFPDSEYKDGLHTVCDIVLQRSN